MEAVAEKPRCKTVVCKKELTYLEEAGCWRCLVCNPIPKEAVVKQGNKTKYVDVPWTEERIRDIVRDELENWSKPTTSVDITSATPETWRQQAKRLGVPLAQPTGGARKKIDVLGDIRKAEGLRQNRNLTATEAVERREAQSAVDSASVPIVGQ